jgi:tetratricopeptide (TPR) repeat protein
MTSCFARLIVRAVVGTLALGCSTSSGIADDDPLGAVVDAYYDFALHLQSVAPAEKVRQQQEWLGHLLSAVEEDPESAHASRALRAAVALANTLGQLDKSISIAERALRLPGLARSDQLDWNRELGDVARLHFDKSRDDGSRQTAIVAYDNVVALLRRNDAPPLDDVASEILIKALARNGVLLRKGGSDSDQLLRAAESFALARAALKEYGRPIGPRSRLQYDEEAFISREAEARLASGDAETALSLLMELGALTELSKPPSFHASIIAGSAARHAPPLYRSFLEAWCRTAPRDDYTADCEFDLAEAYFYSKDYGLALPIYEELRGARAGELLTIDGEAATLGRGGRYAMVLRNLEFIYSQMGRAAEALEAHNEFVRLFPNSPGDTTMLQSSANVLKHQKALADQRSALERRSPQSLWIVLAINAGIIAGVGAVMALRRWRSSRQSDAQLRSPLR